MADFLGVSLAFISHIENGRNKLPEQKAELLMNNDRGWAVPNGSEVAVPVQPYGRSAHDWPAIVADLSAKIGEQNTQIDRLLSIVEQLTAQKK